MSGSPSKKLVATARSLSLPASHHSSTELFIRPNIVARSHSIPHVEIDYISLDEPDMPEMIRSGRLRYNTPVECEPGDSRLAAIHEQDSWVAGGVDGEDEEMNEMSGEKAQDQACISGEEQVAEDQTQEYSPAEAEYEMELKEIVREGVHEAGEVVEKLAHGLDAIQMEQGKQQREELDSIREGLQQQQDSVTRDGSMEQRHTRLQSTMNAADMATYHSDRLKMLEREDSQELEQGYHPTSGELVKLRAVSIIGKDERNELKRKLKQKEINQYGVDYKRSKYNGAANSKMEDQRLDPAPCHQGLGVTDMIRDIACSTCGEVVTSSKEWLIHVHKSFKEEGVREGHFFRCSPCGEVFQSFKLFRLHILDTGHGMPKSNDAATGSKDIATSSRNFATSSKENPIQIDSDSDDGMENCIPTVAEGGMYGKNKEYMDDEDREGNGENERMQENNRSEEANNSAGGSNGESSRSRRSDSIFGRLKPLPGPQDGTFLRRLLEIERERQEFGVNGLEAHRLKLPSERLNVEVRRIEPRDGPANEPGNRYHPLPPKPNVYPTRRGKKLKLRGRVSVVSPKPAPSWGWY